MREKFLFQMFKQRGKIKLLQKMWDSQIQEFTVELFKDKSKVGKERLK